MSPTAIYTLFSKTSKHKFTSCIQLLIRSKSSIRLYLAMTSGLFTWNNTCNKASMFTNFPYNHNNSNKNMNSDNQGMFSVIAMAIKNP